MRANLKANGFDVSTRTLYDWRHGGIATFIEAGGAGSPTRCEISSWRNFLAVIVPAHYAAISAKRSAAGQASGAARRAKSPVSAGSNLPANVLATVAG